MSQPATLDSLIAAAESAGLSVNDLTGWMRTRAGIVVNAGRRNRLRSTEAWRAAMARTVIATGMLESEILSICRQREYIAARDMLVDILTGQGWTPGDIGTALDRHRVTVIAAQERIRRTKRLPRKLEVVK